MITKLIIISSAIALLTGLHSCNRYRIVDKKKSNNYYFNFLKTEVHYVPMGNRFELGDDKLDSVDIKTVKVLGKQYLIDKNHVYFKSTRIKNADVTSFEILCEKKYCYARDKNMIYYNSNSFQDLDITSFQFAGGDCGPFLKDKTHVYSIYPVYLDAFSSVENSMIPPIQNADPEKFQFLNDVYGKDDHNVYYKGKPVVGADAKTFILFDVYAKDTNRIYLDGLQVMGIDPATFTHIDGGGFYKDTNRVYLDGLQVMGIDPATFTHIDGGGYYKDKNGVYFGVDPVNGENGNPIHYSARIVVGADPETFIMIKGEKTDYAKDKTRYYWGGTAE